MNFFQRWLSGIRGLRDVPKIKFGRYNEVLKSEDRFEAWDKSQEAFSEEKFLDAVDHFFFYLYDPIEDNVQWERFPNKIEFVMQQGSQSIEGWATSLKFVAQVSLGEYNEPEESLYQKLLEHNYRLSYSKYCWKEGILIGKFSSNSVDASPYKLYSGLRELALITDKQDDLALAQYKGFRPLFTGRKNALSELVLKTKVEYFEKQVHELEQAYRHCGLDVHEYPGAYAYLLLNFCYKIDFLLSPEAELMELLEEVHALGAEKISAERNEEVFTEIKKISHRSPDSWHEEFYEVNNTFGITSPLSPERLRSFINNEIEKMDWYVREGHREIALSIPGFIVGYSLFHYALPGPFKEFLQLFYEVLDSEYFCELGFRPALSQGGKPLKMEIVRGLKQLIQNLKENYPSLKFSLSEIRYDSAFHFSKSYLQALCQMSW